MKQIPICIKQTSISAFCKEFQTAVECKPAAFMLDNGRIILIRNTVFVSLAYWERLLANTNAMNETVDVIHISDQEIKLNTQSFYMAYFGNEDRDYIKKQMDRFYLDTLIPNPE